jgi:hypothetical protein
MQDKQQPWPSLTHPPLLFEKVVTAYVRLLSKLSCRAEGETVEQCLASDDAEKETNCQSSTRGPVQAFRGGPELRQRQVSPERPFRHSLNREQ